MCEGGGDLNGKLFSHHMVDELKIYLLPIVIGGKHVTLADGRGVTCLGDVPRFRFTEVERFEQFVALSLARTAT